MPPAVEEFLAPSSSSSTQRSYFQNPNPSVPKYSTDSGTFNTSFNPVSFSELDFNCSKDAAAAAAAPPTVRRKKPAKVKKHSSCSGSVSSNSKHVNSTYQTINFVFNASSSGSVFDSSLGKTGTGGDGEQQSTGDSLKSNMLQFTLGSTDDSKSAKRMCSEEVQNSGNDFQSGNLKSNFCSVETLCARKVSEGGGEKLGELNGLDSVFGANLNNGVMNSNSSNCGDDFGSGGVAFRVERESNGTDRTSGTEANTLLVNSISGLNLGTGEPGDVAQVTENSIPDSKTSVHDFEKFGHDFELSAVHRDIQKDMNCQNEESKENVEKLVIGTSGSSGAAPEGLGNDTFGMSFAEINSGNGVNGNVDSGTMFCESKVNGLFHIGNQNQKSSSCKVRRKVNKKMHNLKSEGAGSCDYLKKQDNNINSVRDGNYGFIFGSSSGNAFSDITQSKVSDEAKTSNIHDPAKNNPSKDDLCSYFNNLFVSGSYKGNISSAKPEAPILNQSKAAQETDEVSKVSASEETGKSEPDLVKGAVPSSSSSASLDPGFVPKVHHPEVPPTNEAGIFNNFSFPSNFGVFGTSFTGFNTPDVNVATSFTSGMFSGLGKKLEFSKSNSVGQRKLKKTKTKLRQQGRNRHQGDCNSSKEVPQSLDGSAGCSPMDFSPYGGTEYVSTSTDPATYQVQNVDNVATTGNPSANSFSSSSATSFADADVSARQRPHRKKYIMKSGQGLRFTTQKVSRANESTSGKQTKDSDLEICDKWRKRGNQAYNNGDLSEAEGCYSKGISSIQHTAAPGFCTEPLLLCYSNRAAARMALGRLREGLEDCRIAAALDPTFVKANLRSANCHLLLGEIEDASYNYNKCLGSENIVCLDRRLAIEAADGLQKAQRVANYLKQSAELLQQKTYESATNALRVIADALSISSYSEKLLNMKAEALLVLGKHKDVVQLCEQTLDSAEKNFATDLKLWRCNLMSKSYFHLGRLEVALDFIEKHEQLRPTADNGSVDPMESLAPLAVTVRELLHCKNAGNEAFQNGKHTEAIEHYSTAISKSIESHSFAAVCFCNRAAAHQALGGIIDAIGDCSTAIALDGTYPKALSRRATLWEMIRDYKHAADDLQRLISILETQTGEISRKSNGSVKDVRRARRRLSSVEENSRKERSLDLYLILGIKPSDSAVEVKKAYRKAALRHHPDKAGQVIGKAESCSDGEKWKEITESIKMDADKLFKMIGEAYAVLSDSTKRSKYDLEEEMWDDMNIHASSSRSSNRRESEFYDYNSPFGRRNYNDSRKSYGNYRHHCWEDTRNNYHNSYPRW